MRPASIVLVAVVAAAAIGALLLARPERAPADLTPPPRSAVAQAPDREPVQVEAENVAESGEEPAEEPAKGRSLTRQELETGMLKVRSHALGCRSEGPPPLVVAKLVISPAGSVTSVILPPEVRGTRAGECIAHALRGASFPSWTAPPVPQVEWSYPLRFDAD
jgi:hypothetical protein